MGEYMFFTLPYIALVIIIVFSFSRLDKKEKAFLFSVTVISLFIHVIFAICIQRMPVARHGIFFFIDEYGYDLWSAAIAREWRSGNFPNLWTDQYLGTLHTGWNRILASIYYIFGHRPYLGIVLNIFMSAFLVPLSFFTTRAIFPVKEKIPSINWREKILNDPAHIAALICSIHFSFAFWSAFLLRDIFIAVLFITCILLIVSLYRKWNYYSLAALLLILSGLVILRVYSVGFLLMGPAAYFLFFHKQKKWLWLVMAAGCILMVAARIFIPMRDYQNQILYTFLNNLPDAGKSSIGCLIHCARGVPRFFLGPYAWYISPGSAVIDYMLYPGQWFLYLLIFPWGLKGLYTCMRENEKAAIFPVIPIMLSVFLFLLAYGGSVPRQRLYMEPLFIIFAAWGLTRKEKGRYIPLAWFIFLGLFITAHSISAWQRGLW
jgi:hypothetical protein